MSKYHKLVKRYAVEIEQIKKLWAQYEDFSRRADEIDIVMYPEPDFLAIAKADEWEQLAHEAYNAMCSEWDRLAQDIEAEYWDVPFAKPRQAGTAGFWREAGLAPR